MKASIIFGAVVLSAISVYANDYTDRSLGPAVAVQRDIKINLEHLEREWTGRGSYLRVPYRGATTQTSKTPYYIYDSKGGGWLTISHRTHTRNNLERLNESGVVLYLNGTAERPWSEVVNDVTTFLKQVPNQKISEVIFRGQDWEPEADSNGIVTDTVLPGFVGLVESRYDIDMHLCESHWTGSSCRPVSKKTYLHAPAQYVQFTYKKQDTWIFYEHGDTDYEFFVDSTSVEFWKNITPMMLAFKKQLNRVKRYELRHFDQEPRTPILADGGVYKGKLIAKERTYKVSVDACKKNWKRDIGCKFRAKKLGDFSIGGTDLNPCPKKAGKCLLVTTGIDGYHIKAEGEWSQVEELVTETITKLNHKMTVSAVELE